MQRGQEGGSDCAVRCPCGLCAQEFLTTLQQRFPAKDAKILIACDIGGLLSTNTTRLIASNSFETLFFLQNLGYTNVKVSRDAASTCTPAFHFRSTATAEV